MILVFRCFAGRVFYKQENELKRLTDTRIPDVENRL